MNFIDPTGGNSQEVLPPGFAGTFHIWGEHDNHNY